MIKKIEEAIGGQFMLPKIKDSIRTCLIYTLLCLAFSSCSFGGKQVPPNSIKGKRISFYTSKLAGSNKAFLDHDVIYVYDESGRYKAVYDGQALDWGDYSYYVMNSTEARLIQTYSNNDGLYKYVMNLKFNTPTTGEWEAIQSDDPAITGAESGTFKILDNESKKSSAQGST